MSEETKKTETKVDQKKDVKVEKKQVVENNNQDVKRMYELTDKELDKLDQVRIKLELRKFKNGNIKPFAKIKLDDQKLLVLEFSDRKNIITETKINLVKIKRGLDMKLKELYITCPIRFFKGQHKYDDGFIRDYMRFEVLLCNGNIMRGFLTNDEMVLFEEIGLDKKYSVLVDTKEFEDIDDDF